MLGIKFIKKDTSQFKVRFFDKNLQKKEAVYFKRPLFEVIAVFF